MLIMEQILKPSISIFHPFKNSTKIWKIPIEIRCYLSKIQEKPRLNYTSNKDRVTNRPKAYPYLRDPTSSNLIKLPLGLKTWTWLSQLLRGTILEKRKIIRIYLSRKCHLILIEMSLKILWRFQETRNSWMICGQLNPLELIRVIKLEVRSLNSKHSEYKE